MNFPDIETILPHRGSALLIDAITEFDEEHITTSSQPGDDFPYAQDGRIPSVVCIELIAQSVAAFVGMLHRMKNEPPRIGYLIGTPRMKFHCEDFAVGSAVTVQATCVLRNENAGTFSATVSIGEQTLAEGSVTVIEPPTASSKEPSDP